MTFILPYGLVDLLTISFVEVLETFGGKSLMWLVLVECIMLVIDN